MLRGRCCLQEAIKQAEEGRKAPLGTLNNMLMQMRNNCNHPDLITSKFDNSPTYPPAEELVKQCGKLQLLDRLLTALKAKGHKILIFSQVGPRPSLCLSLAAPGPCLMFAEVLPLQKARDNMVLVMVQRSTVST